MEKTINLSLTMDELNELNEALRLREKGMEYPDLTRVYQLQNILSNFHIIVFSI